MPQLSKIKTCAKVAIQGNGFGSASAFAKSEAKAVKAASSACGDAVANGMADLCTGKDPMATIYSMSQTCATAVAEVYSKATSGATVTDGKAILDVWKKVGGPRAGRWLRRPPSPWMAALALALALALATALAPLRSGVVPEVQAAAHHRVP
jgi:hypothetical protein